MLSYRRHSGLLCGYVFLPKMPVTVEKTGRHDLTVPEGGGPKNFLGGWKAEKVGASPAVWCFFHGTLPALRYASDSASRNCVRHRGRTGEDEGECVVPYLLHLFLGSGSGMQTAKHFES